MRKELEDACRSLVAHAYTVYNAKYCGNCAAAVRNAIEFGFKLKITRVTSAKDYGSSYEKIGFKKIISGSNLEHYQPELGDLAIIHYEPHGHICMLTEKGWCSDFYQRDLYGGSIRKEKPLVDIYRFS